MPLDIDEAAFPVVVIDMVERLTDEDVQAWMDGGVRWIGRGRPYALVIVARKVELPRIDQIKPLVRWMNENADGLDRYHKVMAVVTASPVLRGALRAIFKLRRLYAEQLVTEEREEAIRWASDRIRELSVA